MSNIVSNQEAGLGCLIILIMWLFVCYKYTFTFMHLADAFIQSDLQCIQVTLQHFTFDQLLLSLGIEPMILVLLAPCSTSWATGKLTFDSSLSKDADVCSLQNSVISVQIVAI